MKNSSILRWLRVAFGRVLPDSLTPQAYQHLEVSLEHREPGYRQYRPFLCRSLLRYCLVLSLIPATSSCGDVGSSHTNNVTNVNSGNPTTTDNSQHGIASCTSGSTFTCSQNGPNDCSQSLKCTNVDGTPVVLSGPEPIACDTVAQCPTPAPTPKPTATP